VWEYEYAGETTASPETVWSYFADIASWPTWNAGIEKLEVNGPFEVGSTFTMTPPGEDPVTMKLVEIVPGEVWTDEMDAGDFIVRTIHRLRPSGTGGTTIIYRTEFHGPAADQVGPEIGPAITADFPDVVSALAAVAEKSASAG
ncbi:MAG TPA: SRPBCC family protein, partial [Streptosporangiaceae bacterium]|jgi:uncharacterized protein YndB with AHSA1/START domain